MEDTLSYARQLICFEVISDVVGCRCPEDSKSYIASANLERLMNLHDCSMRSFFFLDCGRAGLGELNVSTN